LKAESLVDVWAGRLEKSWAALTASMRAVYWAVCSDDYWAGHWAEKKVVHSAAMLVSPMAGTRAL
jgi:hypothetical protein